MPYYQPPLPPEVEKEIEEFLIATNFCRYRELAALIREKFSLDLSVKRLSEFGRTVRSRRREMRAFSDRIRAFVAVLANDPDRVEIIASLAAKLIVGASPAKMENIRAALGAPRQGDAR